MKTNQQIIEALYEAFGQGNVPFIIESVAENFTWTDPCDPAVVPHGGTYTGSDEFPLFFQRLGSNTTTTGFEVNSYVSEGDTVCALGKHGVIVNATGKSNLIDWIMVWQFEGNKPVRGRNYYDTAAMANAFQS